MAFPFSSRITLLRVAAVVAGLCARLTPAQLSFTRLGGLYPTDVSSNGAFVVGRNYPGTDLFRWSKDSGSVLLKQNALAGGISADGQTILANAVAPPGGLSGTIYKWTAADGFSVIATHNAGYLHGAGLSGNGQIAVGNFGLQAARWVETSPQFLGMLPGGNRSFALAISEDGKTIVGHGETADPRVHHAFRWTESTGMVDMGLLGGITSIAQNVSSDGAFVVGSGVRSAQRGGIAAFIWNEAAGYTTIGPGMPAAVSMDGSLVGGSYYDFKSSVEQGFLWSPEFGFREVSSVLKVDYGFGSELDDWQNLVPTEMSPDGRYIIGYGLSEGSTEGWLLDRGLDPPDIAPGIPPDFFSPVPEPGTFGLVAASLLFAVMVANRRRRQWPAAMPREVGQTGPGCGGSSGLRGRGHVSGLTPCDSPVCSRFRTGQPSVEKASELDANGSCKIAELIRGDPFTTARYAL